MIPRFSTMLIVGLILSDPVSRQPSSPGSAADFRRVAAVPERFQPLPLGAVRPRGWLRSQIEANLDGFTGHLDDLVPDLIVRDQIYGRDRLSPTVRHKDVGAQGVPDEDQAQFLWWNSETQSNWWDGYVRSAVLVDRPAAVARARAQVAAVLATQDHDGYIGIYTPALRYRFHDENGELWSKATCYRYLLGWYDYSRDPEVLHAVVRAVDNLMQGYPQGASHPFRSGNPRAGGLTHGLAITDVLESLFRITGDPRYAEYLLFCYQDFSAEPLDEDAQLTRLLDEAAPLRGHGAHTYEHLRSVAAAYQVSGDARIGEALGDFLRKIGRCTTASGGPVGDEFIDGRGEDATTRGYEYCSLQELNHGYASLLLKTGRSGYGDAAERLFFNAAQGARHPHGEGVAYLKSDNSYAMTGPLNADPSQPSQTRYKYSPTHRDAAVCCVPNAGRIGPYFVQSMWMKDGDALVASLLGPCVVATDIAGRAVRIVEETDYPFGNVLHFTIEGADCGLTLKVRRPGWARHLEASAPFTERDGFLDFTLAPGSGNRVLTVRFRPELLRQTDLNGEIFFSYGALVLCHPLPSLESVAKTYPTAGFRDLHYTPVDLQTYLYPEGAVVRPVSEQPGHFEAELVNASTRRKEWVRLEPMSGTILRQTSFRPAPAGAPPAAAN